MDYRGTILSPQPRVHSGTTQGCHQCDKPFTPRRFNVSPVVLTVKRNIFLLYMGKMKKEEVRELNSHEPPCKLGSILKSVQYLLHPFLLQPYLLQTSPDFAWAGFRGQLRKKVIIRFYCRIRRLVRFFKYLFLFIFPLF